MLTKVVDKLKSLRRKASGFTLVELLVVIAIIAILATIVLLTLGGARVKGRDTKRMADMSQVQSAIELYSDANGQVPQVATWAALCTALAPAFLQSCPPNGPLGATDVYHYAYNGKTKYQVAVQLETTTPPTSDADINATVAGWTGTGVNGTLETCTSASVTGTDCYFDVGSN